MAASANKSTSMTTGSELDSLAAARDRAEGRRDLRWLFDGSYEAALGIRSAHASLVSLLEGGRGTNGGSVEAQTHAEEGMIEAVSRGRPTRAALALCTQKTRRILAAFYNPEKPSAYWRELTHVLPLTDIYDRKVHGPIDGGIGLRMTLRNASPEQQDAAMRLRRAAEQLVADAHADFDAAHAKATTQRGRDRTRWVRSERRQT